jgi:hypothetical protein
MTVVSRTFLKLIYILNLSLVLNSKIEYCEKLWNVIKIVNFRYNLMNASPNIKQIEVC